MVHARSLFRDWIFLDLLELMEGLRLTVKARAQTSVRRGTNRINICLIFLIEKPDSIKPQLPKFPMLNCNISRHDWFHPHHLLISLVNPILNSLS